jgi:uncharacterized delta-60 repeat protein
MKYQMSSNLRKLAGILLLTAAGVLCASAAWNGDIDVVFNNGGYSRFGFREGADSGRAAARQPDGKLVVASTTWQGLRTVICVLRYLPDGSADASFGDGGKAYIILDTDISVGTDSIEAEAVAIQPDGRIVVAGTGRMLNPDFRVARLNADGSRDLAFGINGFATTDFAADDDFAEALIVQNDNKIVVAGTATATFGNAQHFAVARYMPDGSPDLGFNGSGKVTAEGGPGLSAVMQPDGKIVVGGRCGGQMCAVRFRPDGPVDTSFGVSGRATASGAGGAASALIQPDGKLVFVGYISTPGRFDFARFNPDGTMDNTFGSNGITHIDAGGYNDLYTSSAVMRSDGSIQAAGYVRPSFDQSWLAAARVDANGSPDGTFGDGGHVVASLLPGPQQIFASVLDTGGKVLLVGSGREDVLLGKLRQDGSIDTDYGDQGVTITDAGDLACDASAMALQPDGKMIIVGSRGNSMPLVARLNADASPDTSFGQTGKLVLNQWEGVKVTGVVVRPDERIIIAANYNGGLDNSGFMIGRITRDGLVDSSFGVQGRIFVSSATALALALDTEGRILAGGSSTLGSHTVFRFNEDGTPDRYFGRQGKFNIPDSSSNLTALTIQPDGKIVAVGQAGEGANRIFLSSRLNPNGTLDAGFGKGGVVHTDITQWPDYATSVAIDAAGKIVVAGYSAASPLHNAFVVARYNGDGSLDQTFNGAGTSMTGINSYLDRALGVAIRTDGKIVVAGNQSGSFGGSIATVRFNADGIQDVLQWGSQGIARANLVGSDSGVAIALDSFGRPLVAGTCMNLFCVTRFTSEFAPVFLGSVSGLVERATGRKPALVQMRDPAGNMRMMQTDRFGRYRFDDVPTGGVYTFIITQPGRAFTPRQVTVSGHMVDVNFTSDG